MPFCKSRTHRVRATSSYLRRALRIAIFILCLIACERLAAQTLGGNAVFNFLRLPPAPQLTALGGINVSKTSDDLGLALNNPALLRPSMHTQMTAVFNTMYDGINAYTLALGYHHQKSQTSFSWGLNYIDYGDIPQADASGNLLGRFRPTDWVMQLSASRSYLQKWRYGGSLKFISSNYGQYRSNGIAVDVGVLYDDTAKGVSISLLAKNMGTQLRKYDGTEADDLPFDLQVGITRRLLRSPFSFSFTAHHLHRFDMRYNDETFDAGNNADSAGSSKFTIDKLFRHFVFATSISLGDNVEIDAGFNYLRRKELNIANSGNGLTGFSMGVSLLLSKLQVRYARAHYQNNTAYNQFGLNMTLNKYFGLKKFGERIGW